MISESVPNACYYPIQPENCALFARALALTFLPFVCSAHRVVNLSGLSGWILHNANHSISVPAQLPSEQYQDLYSAGVIADPLYGFNDSIEEWVQMTNWTYTSPILAGLHSSDDGSQIWLVFEGLDTFTSIEICNKTIGKTNNQFRQYLFDVTSALDSCTEPRLSVAFFSAAEVAYATSTSSRAQREIPDLRLLVQSRN